MASNRLGPLKSHIIFYRLMKWGLLFLIILLSLFSLNSLALLIGGGPNNSGAGVYTQTITVNGGLASKTLNGNTPYYAPWANPSYLSNTSTGGLIITPDHSYTYNNVSFLPSGNAGFALNVTFVTPSTTSSVLLLLMLIYHVGILPSISPIYAHIKTFDFINGINILNAIVSLLLN